MALIELEPGAVVPEHRHPQEQVGVLLTGSMTFVIDGEEKTFGPGGTWTIRGDVPHSVEAGPEGAVLYEIFSPTREADWAGIAREAPRAPRWPASS